MSVFIEHRERRGGSGGRQKAISGVGSPESRKMQAENKDNGDEKGGDFKRERSHLPTCNFQNDLILNQS